MKKLSGIFFFVALSAFGQTQKTPCPNPAVLTASAPKGPYLKHLDSSKGFKIKAIKNLKALSKYRDNGKLQEVQTLGKGYRIQKLQHSKAVLVPKAKTVLKDLAKSFHTKSKGSTLTFTSLTRTFEDQCRLRQVNPNASVGLSTHNYGNAFDVSYVRFNDRLQRNERLEKMLETILKEYEKQGKIYYIREKQQSCFHVTVRS